MRMQHGKLEQKILVGPTTTKADDKQKMSEAT